MTIGHIFLKTALKLQQFFTVCRFYVQYSYTVSYFHVLLQSAEKFVMLVLGLQL